MSKSIVFDRRKGFVALPVEVLEIDLSPGAFRLLVELCRMANLEGFCWPSLGQLGERLGRSKAAISGYVQDLREAELITTEEQRTANGYNYRLRYCVTFWAAWRTSLTGRTKDVSTGQNDESRVRQSERRKDSKNQIQKNHDQGERIDLRKLTRAWAEIAKGAPYPALRRMPEHELVSETEAAVAESPGVISADISRKVDAVWRTLDLDQDTTAAKAAVEFLASKNFSEHELDAALRAIQQAWPAHWRRIPGPKQLDQMLISAEIVPCSAQIKLLKSYLNRWKQAQKRLRKDLSCESLTKTAMLAPCPAAPPNIHGYG